jgi:hypothetical protein
VYGVFVSDYGLRGREEKVGHFGALFTTEDTEFTERERFGFEWMESVLIRCGWSRVAGLRGLAQRHKVTKGRGDKDGVKGCEVMRSGCMGGGGFAGSKKSGSKGYVESSCDFARR